MRKFLTRTYDDNDVEGYKEQGRILQEHLNDVYKKLYTILIPASMIQANKIKCIKLVRETEGLGLKEAKEYVERLINTNQSYKGTCNGVHLVEGLVGYDNGNPNPFLTIKVWVKE